MTNRYIPVVWHGEHASIYSVVDTAQPESEQPAVIHEWSTAVEPQARYLATDFCIRHNTKA